MATNLLVPERGPAHRVQVVRPAARGGAVPVAISRAIAVKAAAIRAAVNAVQAVAIKATINAVPAALRAVHAVPAAVRDKDKDKDEDSVLPVLTDIPATRPASPPIMPTPAPSTHGTSPARQVRAVPVLAVRMQVKDRAATTVPAVRARPVRVARVPVVAAVQAAAIAGRRTAIGNQADHRHN